jgi:CheY-like chemotaxis protein
MEAKTRNEQKRMLLANANRLFLTSLEGILIAGGNGWQTVKVSDGRQALVELDDGTFDLIVADYQMPGVSGLELVTAMRQKLPGIPVIMTTGNDSHELREQAERLGVSRVLEWPIPGPTFLGAVAALSGKEAGPRQIGE